MALLESWWSTTQVARRAEILSDVDVFLTVERPTRTEYETLVVRTRQCHLQLNFSDLETHLFLQASYSARALDQD
ncbi:hypothetical protein HYQ44_004514 [Verticillium longisporum]|nr:hypothetical protein HYQ44_004514 [Verticillium longisporum]